MNRYGWLVLCPWQVEGDDHSMAINIGCVLRTLICILHIGWGWDAEMPLRPWPQLSTRTTPGGNQGFCLTMCGFFINFRWRRCK